MGKDLLEAWAWKQEHLNQRVQSCPEQSFLGTQLRFSITNVMLGMRTDVLQSDAHLSSAITMSLITISLIENKLSIEKGLTGGMGMKTGGAPRRVVKFVSGRSLWVLNQGSQINKIMRGLRMDVLQGTIYCVQLSPL